MVIELHKNPYMIGLTDQYGKVYKNPKDYIEIYEDIWTLDEYLNVTFERYELISNCNSTTISNFNELFKVTPCDNGG